MPRYAAMARRPKQPIVQQRRLGNTEESFREKWAEQYFWEGVKEGVFVCGGITAIYILFKLPRWTVGAFEWIIDVPGRIAEIGLFQWIGEVKESIFPSPIEKRLVKLELKREKVEKEKEKLKRKLKKEKIKTAIAIKMKKLRLLEEMGKQTEFIPLSPITAADPEKELKEIRELLVEEPDEEEKIEEAPEEKGLEDELEGEEDVPSSTYPHLKIIEEEEKEEEEKEEEISKKLKKHLIPGEAILAIPEVRKKIMQEVKKKKLKKSKPKKSRSKRKPKSSKKLSLKTGQDIYSVTPRT